MLHKGELGTRMQLSKVYLIQEGTDEKDASAGAAEEIFWSEGVGKRVWVESFALVGDFDDEGFSVVFEGDGDLFVGVVCVSVQDCVDGGFTGCHDDAEAFILIEAGIEGEFFHSLFDLGDAIHGGSEAKG